MCRAHGRRCPSSAPKTPAQDPEPETQHVPGQQALYGLPPHEPGTGPDWASARMGDSDLVPVPPATTVTREWDKIPRRGVATDREQLAWLEDQATKHSGTGQGASAEIGLAQLRQRAAAGYHDGSLPELGHYHPVYFVPAEETSTNG